MKLDYTRCEADFQIEVRYTAGGDEYHRGEPFDPSKDEQEYLADEIGRATQEAIRASYAKACIAGGVDLVIPPYFPISVWIKPFYKSSFTPLAE